MLHASGNAPCCGKRIQCGMMQGRAASVGQVLYGTYAIPSTADQPIDIVLNPQGDEARSKKR